MSIEYCTNNHRFDGDLDIECPVCTYLDKKDCTDPREPNYGCAGDPAYDKWSKKRDEEDLKYRQEDEK